MNHLDSSLYIGIDVSKRLLHVASSDSSRVIVHDNEPSGIRKLIDFLRSIQTALVCLEATGGYERLLVQTLVQAGFKVAVVNPRLIRDFARATNRLAKTDRIDAQIIALFAQKMQPSPTPLLSQSQRNIQDLQTRRRQINEMIVQEKNRLDTMHHPKIRRLIEKAIKLYKEQLDEIDQELKEAIKDNPELFAKVNLIQSVPGLGMITAAKLVADLPELGQINRAQIARLTGLAPINRDSGTYRGKRMTGGGRTHVRTALYMPTLVAIKHNPFLKDYYQRLLKNGKQKLVAIVATMRKLLCILNSIVRNNIPWKNVQTNT